MSPNEQAAEIEGHGSYAQAARLAAYKERLQPLRVAPSDCPELIERKEHERDVLTRRVFDIAEQGIESRAMMSQTGIFLHHAAPLGGKPRVTIMLAGRRLSTGVDPALDLNALRVGQHVETDANGGCVLSASDEVPQDGQIVRVLKVLPLVDSQRWLEVEEHGGGALRARVSGFIADATIRVGAGVRVVDGFAYEVDPDFVERRSFLDECLWVPDGRITFDDVLGQGPAVTKLKMLVDRFGDRAAYPGVEQIGNVQKLLLGAPGNGKTMLWMAVANALYAVFGDLFRAYLIRASAVKDKFVGNSDKNTRSLFAQPIKDYEEQGIVSLLGFEEFETIAASRAGITDNTSVSQGIVNTLLSYLDGVEPLRGVITMAMTNFPAMLDEALVRPGRLGGTNSVEISRLGPAPMRAIVRRRVELLGEAFEGTTIDDYCDAAEAAMGLTYGEAVVGKDKEPIKGRHLTSGAAASGAVSAALELVHEHIFSCRQQRLETPYNQVRPATLYWGMVQTLHNVLATYAGPRNLTRARAFFAGDLVHRDEPNSLQEVRILPLDCLEDTPEAYDLQPMRELEQPPEEAC